MVQRHALVLSTILLALGLSGCGQGSAVPATPQDAAINLIRSIYMYPPTKDAPPPAALEKALNLTRDEPGLTAEGQADLSLEQVVFFTRGDIARLKVEHPATRWDAVESGMPEGMGCLVVRSDARRRRRDVLILNTVEGRPGVVARADLGWGPRHTPPPAPQVVIPPQAAAAAKRILQTKLASAISDRRYTATVTRIGGETRTLTDSQRSAVQKMLSEGVAAGEYSFKPFGQTDPGGPSMPTPSAMIDLKPATTTKSASTLPSYQFLLFAEGGSPTTVVPSLDAEIPGFAFFPGGATQQWVEERFKSGSGSTPTAKTGSSTPASGVAPTTPSKKTTTSSKTTGKSSSKKSSGSKSSSGSRTRH